MAGTTSSRASSKGSSSKSSGKTTTKATSKSSIVKTPSKGGKTYPAPKSNETKARESLQRSLARDFPDMSEKSRSKL